MRQGDIKVGSAYGDGKGNIRVVRQCPCHDIGKNFDLKYFIKKGRGYGICGYCTLKAFAKWAKERIENET